MDDKLNGRAVYAPQGKDPDQDASALADAVARSAAKLINRGGQLVWIRDGKLYRVDPNAARVLITEHVVTVRLVNRGTAEEPNVDIEYIPYEPTPQDIRALPAEGERPLTVQRAQGSSLLVRVPRV